MVRVLNLAALASLASRALCSPVSEPNPSLAISVQLAGHTFINKVTILSFLIYS